MPHDRHLDGEELARRLDALPGYRVLRALDINAGVESLGQCGQGERIAAVVDTETTGLNLREDKLVEVAIQRFIFDQSGGIIQLERVRSWIEDPREPIPERVAKLTGLSDDMMAGRAFEDGAIIALLSQADIIVAHNAAFDRAFIDRRFPALADYLWACSFSQLDWLSLGFDGSSLGHLLLQSGRFFLGHRAANDVAALSTLLGLSLPDGRTVMSHLLARCELDSVLIEAVDASFETKDILKDRGYRWNSMQRHWWREVDTSELASEVVWLDGYVYRGHGKPNLITVMANDRFKLK